MIPEPKKQQKAKNSIEILGSYKPEAKKESVNQIYNSESLALMNLYMNHRLQEM